MSIVRKTKCKDVYRWFEAQLFKFIRTTDQAVLSVPSADNTFIYETEYHIEIVLYNSQSILPYIISFLPHKKTDTLVGEILYSTSSKAEAEWKNFSDSHMNTEFVVIDSRCRQKF